MIRFSPIPSNLENKRILMRVDFNVPMSARRVADDFRLLRILPSIQEISRKGARIILISHLEVNDHYPTLAGIFRFLKPKLKSLKFSRLLTGQKVKSLINDMRSGDVLMLENLRRDAGEKLNSPGFAKELALLGDLYINEAFSVSHRRHTSIVGIPDYLPSFAGPLFREEVGSLSRVFKPPHPFLFILGGKKIETKVPLLEKFLEKADRVVVAGALITPLLLKEKRAKHFSKVMIPRDVVVMRGKRKKTIDFNQITQGDVIYDFGPKSIQDIKSFIKKSRFVLWNGPLGWIEGGFSKATLDVAHALAASKAEVIVGGGDTASFLHRRKLLGKFVFVSTAGGAMLDFLVKGTLPGIEVLRK